MKKIKGFLIHSYMIATLLWIVVALADRTIGDIVFAWGADAWWIASSFVSDYEMPRVLALLLSCWWITFPIVIVVGYILAWKGKPVLFCVNAAIEMTIGVAFCIVCFVSQREPSLAFAPVCAIVNTIYMVLLIGSVWLEHRTGDGLREP